ncbi:uncharacterized protein LOC117788694 isoform X2 [Drosophila innubila]|uniref:uncharacterized protein LOC117788694 isoform X2 n=1 Tax=Drosophila innubila TaxID=198719 RepID=UPI00148BEE01|nr:uncharacterized protein LOC117788694 isoform X2 [Drosophila innubila]
MEHNHKQNSFRRSETMSRIESHQSKSISSKGGITKNMKGYQGSRGSSNSCEKSPQNTNSSEKSSGITNGTIGSQDSNGSYEKSAHNTTSSEKSSGITNCIKSSQYFSDLSSYEEFQNNHNTISRHGKFNNDAVSSIHSSYVQSGNGNKTIANEKSHGIRGFLKLLPFLPRLKHKILSTKPNNARKQTSLSRIRIHPSSSLEETDVRKLIRLYESYENLYNPKHKDYGNSKIEEKCYSKIANCFPNKTSQELQNLLYELRLLFEREYTIIENRQRRFGHIVLPSIKYYNEFLFLVPFLNVEWESGACLPPKIPHSEETKSFKSDDWSMTSSKDFTHKKLNRKVSSKTSGEDSSLVQSEQIIKQENLQISNSQPKSLTEEKSRKFK